jgi:hypothetical protein
LCGEAQSTDNISGQSVNRVNVPIGLVFRVGVQVTQQAKSGNPEESMKDISHVVRSIRDTSVLVVLAT